MTAKETPVDAFSREVAQYLEASGVTREAAHLLKPSQDVTGKLKLEMVEPITGDDYARIDTALKTKYGARYEAGAPDARPYWLMDMPKPTAEKPKADDDAPIEETTDGLRSASDEPLAIVYVANGVVNVLFDESKTFNIKTPPFENFLIEKIFTAMQTKDRERVRLGQLQASEIFSWTTMRDGDRLVELCLKNLRTQQRLKEVKTSIKWTLEKMWEKNKDAPTQQPSTSAPPAPAVETKTASGTKSPADIFRERFCTGCADLAKCGPVEAKNCLEIMRLFEIQRQTDELSKLNKFLTSTQFKPASQLQQQPQSPAPAPVQQPKPAAPAQQLRTIADVKKLIPPIITESLKPFEETNDQIILRTKQKLGTDQFRDLKDIVKGMGGDYISAGADSRFWIPKRRA